MWSHVEFFRELFTSDDAHSLQSFPVDKIPRKASNDNFIVVSKLQRNRLFMDYAI